MRFILFSTFLTLSYLGVSQVDFNDTIIYKSGWERPVEVGKMNEETISFQYITSKGDTSSTTVSLRTLRDFVIYDPEGILMYRMSEHEPKEVERINTKYPDSASVSHHMLSVNPFFLPFLSASIKYQYNFGKRMQFGLVTRSTFVSSLIRNDIENRGDLRFSAGIKVTPFYNEKFSFGIDISPTVILDTENIENPHFAYPLNLNFDIFLNRFIGLSSDFGLGVSYHQGYQSYLPRAFFGVLVQFPDKKTFKTGYLD